MDLALDGWITLPWDCTLLLLALGLGEGVKVRLRPESAEVTAAAAAAPGHGGQGSGAGEGGSAYSRLPFLPFLLLLRLRWLLPLVKARLGEGESRWLLPRDVKTLMGGFVCCKCPLLLLRALPPPLLPPPLSLLQLLTPHVGNDSLAPGVEWVAELLQRGEAKSAFPLRPRPAVSGLKARASM